MEKIYYSWEYCIIQCLLPSLKHLYLSCKGRHSHECVWHLYLWIQLYLLSPAPCCLSNLSFMLHPVKLSLFQGLWLCCGSCYPAAVLVIRPTKQNFWRRGHGKDRLCVSVSRVHETLEERAPASLSGPIFQTTCTIWLTQMGVMPWTG